MRKEKKEIGRLTFVEMTQENEIAEILNNFSSCLTSLRKGEDFQKKIAKKFALNANFKVALCDGEIAGFIAFYANNSVDKIAYISMIAVKEKYRKQGFGLLLLQECEKNAKVSAMKTINLEVLLENTAAIEFYKRNGFICKEKRATALLMSKDI